MSDMKVTMVIPAGDKDHMNKLAEAVYEGGRDTFTVGFSPTGKLPITHYVASGYLSDVYGKNVKVQDWEYRGNQNPKWFKVKEQAEKLATLKTVIQSREKILVGMVDKDITDIMARADISTSNSYHNDWIDEQKYPADSWQAAVLDRLGLKAIDTNV
jgi:hypothetical protein